MKRLIVFPAALMVSTAAFAADLPTKKGDAASPTMPNCFASLSSYFNSTPADCPLSYWGVTLYANIDMGVGYETHGTPFNTKLSTGVEEFISKNSNKGLWLATPNGVGQSQVGLKAKVTLGYGWMFVGDVATGFDPYSLQLANGPGSMVQNNTTLLQNQSSNGDSSRAGQWYNSVGYGGFSHDQFGTITVGRQNTLTLDGVSAYDPMGGSYAFSPIGYSGKTAGVGDTEDGRINTAIKYSIKYNNFRASSIMQFGGYSYGNGSNGEWQIGLGADFAGFSIDGIYSRVRDAVSLATYNGPVPAGVPTNALRATISDDSSIMLLTKYKWNQVTVYGGWEHITYTNPSDTFVTTGTNVVFNSLGNFPVVGSGISTTAYGSATAKPLKFEVLWTGVKYALNERVDIAGAYYLYVQHDFNNNATPATCANNIVAPAPGYVPLGTTSNKCRGYMNAFSAMIDYRPLKRVDLYAGFMFSKVSGGLATGYLARSNFDPTVGVRVRF